MIRGEELAVVTNARDAIELQEAAIRRTATNGKPIEILEAGCGRSWPFKLDGVRYRLTGIDLDADALKHRVEVQRDLHEALVGDLQTVSIEAGKFDVIYCSFVLEHIDGARDVLFRFNEWLKPGGSIIIKVPDPKSAHGFATKLTPHWFHILYYKYIVGYREAGTPGHGPYRTYYDRVVSRSGIHEFCREQKLIMINEAGMAEMARYGGWRDRGLRLVRGIINVGSLGRLSSRHSNLLFVIGKPSKGDS